MASSSKCSYDESLEPSKLRFLSEDQARKIKGSVGTPTYVYSENELLGACASAMQFPNAFGLTVRFAMKACPNAYILKLFNDAGLHIDASSGFEVHRALAAGIPPKKISLSTQELPVDFAQLVRQGVKLNCCSLNQLKKFCEVFGETDIGIRFNPGLGSGSSGKTNVGGPFSSFGIWHEFAEEAAAIARRAKNRIVRIHTHIGSGSDPAVWQRVSVMTINLCRKFDDVTTINLGGGYKVARVPGETYSDMNTIGKPVKYALEAFAKETGRKLHLEIEPGTFLVAHAGSLISSVQDIVSTGENGKEFLKLDTGMTEILRPSIYGAQHGIVVIQSSLALENSHSYQEKIETKEYVVVGHCCESGDLLTPSPGNPEVVSTRRLQVAQIGDICVIEGSGAYCSSMSAKNYNSFPEAPEVLIARDGSLILIRSRQQLQQLWENETNSKL